MNKLEYETVNVKVLAVTDKAAKMQYEDDVRWVPRSLLSVFTDEALDNIAMNSDMTIKLLAFKAKEYGWA